MGTDNNSISSTESANSDVNKNVRPYETRISEWEYCQAKNMQLYIFISRKLTEVFCYRHELTV